MNDHLIAVTIITVIGCTLLGVWAGSWMVGVGIYCCIAGLGNWKS